MKNQYTGDCLRIDNISRIRTMSRLAIELFRRCGPIVPKSLWPVSGIDAAYSMDAPCTMPAGSCIVEVEDNDYILVLSSTVERGE